MGKEEKPQRGQTENCLSNITDWNKDFPAGTRATILKRKVLLLPVSFELGVLTQFDLKMEKLWWKCSFSWLWWFHRHVHMLKLIEVCTSNSVMYSMSIFPRSSYREYLCAAKSLQSCPTLCDPIDGSPKGSPIPGILQARTLEWVAISFPNAWKWKVKVKTLSRARLLATPWTPAYQASPSLDFPGKSIGVGCHCLLWDLG